MSPADAPPRWIRIAPFLFIVIWASGYVVAKLAAPYAEPLTFLLLRYAGVIVLMAALALVARAPWPSSGSEIAHLAVAGIERVAAERRFQGVGCGVCLSRRISTGRDASIAR